MEPVCALCEASVLKVTQLSVYEVGSPLSSVLSDDPPPHVPACSSGVLAIEREPDQKIFICVQIWVEGWRTPGLDISDVMSKERKIWK